jgi:hypothetical protein
VTERITYYAIVDEFSSLEHPAGVLRRVKTGSGTTDEVFSSDLKWTFSPLMYEAERGDLANEFVPISEAEAARIVDRIKELAESAERD